MKKDMSRGHARRVPLRFRLVRRLPRPVLKLLLSIAAPRVSVGASAVIWDAENRVFLVHHTYRRPGWGFPSGLVGRGEQPPAALVRELHEELSIEATVGPLLHAEVDVPFPHLTLFYAAQLHGIPSHDGAEIDAIRYAALDEVEALVGAPVAQWLIQLHNQRA